MPIRLIAFDLDDTLLTDDRTVAADDLEAIARARRMGILIVPASGRRYESMLDTLTTLRHEGSVIALNGAEVLSCPSAAVRHSRYVDPALCADIAKAAKEMDVYLQFYMDDHFEYERDCQESELYGELSGKGGRAVGDMEAFIRAENRPSKKLLFIEQDMDKMAKLQAAMDARFGGALSIFRSKPFYLEMTHKEATKGGALRNICREEGILPSQVMAVGDGENDLAMIEWAGVGVAMGNASDAVKARADFVTQSNMQCGVAKAIERFAL